MEQASDLSRELTSMGQTIVSGLAFGVDQAAIAELWPLAAPPSP
jgi:predicted Rossmann fold nucleotide-binding protein DprA/Smf involved in DNA uptake